MAEIADFAANEEPNPYLNLKAQASYEADPTNPYARIKAAEAKGVQLDTEAPVGQPGFLGGLADIGRSLAQGAISYFPQQIGQTAEFFGAPEAGKRLQDFAEEQAAAHPELKQSQVGQIANADPLSIRGGVYSGGQNMILSSGPALAGAAVGAGIGAIGGPPGIATGAGIGYALGSLAALPIFYGSQAQQSKEAIQKGLLAKGVPEAEAEKQSNIGGHWSGFTESGGELIGDIIPFHALFNPLAKAVKGQLVKSSLGQVGRRVAANILGIEATEVSTEMAQQALEDQIEKEYGSGGPGATWKSTLSVVVPTALMTIIPGGFTSVHTFRTNLQVKGALANPDAAPEQRAAAAALIFHSIKGEDPVAAHAFDLYAANQIEAEKPIEIKDDAGYIEDWKNWLQKPSESAVPPDIALRPPVLQAAQEGTLAELSAQPAPTRAERMGIDETAGPMQAAAATAVNTGATEAVPAQAAATPEAMTETAKAAQDAADEAQKASDQAVKEQEAQRKDAWAGLDRRLKIMANEAANLATKAKESAPDGQKPQLPAIHKALVAVSDAHWDPAAATRALRTALDENRVDVVHALVERAQRVAEEANQAKPSVPPDSGMYEPIQAALTKKAEAAQRVADKFAAMAKLQPETPNGIQVAGPGGPVPYQPTGGGERSGVGQGIEGTPPAEAGTGQGERGPGLGGEPVGPSTVAAPQTPPVVRPGEDKQGNPPNVPGPQETPQGPVAQPGYETAGGTATGPQIEAENFKKPRHVVAGFPVAAENYEGQTRRSKPGVEPAWETKIQNAHYGHFDFGQPAADSTPEKTQKVDVFWKPGTTEEHAGPVFVIDQQGKDGKFDEHKVMLGYANQPEAISAYKANYPAGWKVGPVTQATNEQVKGWLKSGDTTKPFAEREQQPMDKLVDYDKLEETDDKGQPTGRYATGKVVARDALDDIEKRLEFARAMRDCLGV